MNDSTGSVAMQNRNEVQKKKYGPMSLFPPSGIGKSTLISIVIWIIPIIFGCGIFFSNTGNTDEKARENSSAIKTIQEKQHKLCAEQQVHSSQMENISKTLSELKSQSAKISEKLEQTNKDLVLIKAKLRIKK